MTLRTKTIVTLAVVLMVMICTLIGIARTVWLKSFSRLEELYVNVDTERAVGALNKDIQNIDDKIRDWTVWDDTYAFVQDKNPEYIKSNLQDSNFIVNHFNFMVFTNKNGSLVYAKQYDLEKGRAVPLSSGIQQLIASKSRFFNQPGKGSKTVGILMLPEGPVLIASRPVLTSSGSGPVMGSLTAGHYLNQSEIENLSATTRLKLSVQPWSEWLQSSQIPASLRNQPDLYKGKTDVYPIDKNYTAGYHLITDVNGQPALVVRVIVPRQVFQQGLTSIRYFLWYIKILAVIIFLVTYYLLSVLILREVEKLNKEVVVIGQQGGPESRVSVQGRDEIASLGLSINRMLQTIEHSHQELRERENQYRQLFNENITANFVVARDGSILLCNPAFIHMFGFASLEEACGSNIATLFPDQQKMREWIRSVLGQGSQQTFEITLQGRDGRQVVVVGNAVAKLDAQGEVEQVTGYLFDVTERKQAERRLRFLSQHDPGTGLYNRAYFEETMHQLESWRLTPVAIIMCDIDGLKLVNDTMGNDLGDHLLLVTANILQECVGRENVVARVGGDEFAVFLLPDLAGEVSRVVNDIRQRVDDYNSQQPGIPLSLSVGWAQTSDPEARFADLYKEAENYMYREKLHRSQSGRSSLVGALTSTLEARDYITEGHAERLQHLVEKMAHQLRLPDQRIRDLRLLAQFHDIGKVGIPDRILNKPGPLTDEERQEMQRHSEIGYRIAQAAPDLHHISDWILKHHEWWNGQGYPLGMAGEDIPIENRILAIADAFDVMTSDRPYRKAWPVDRALEEIKRCAGTQFDPGLVEKFLAMMRPNSGLSSVAATTEN